MHRFTIGTCSMHLRIVPQGPWIVRGQTDRETFRDHRGQPATRDVLQPLLDLQRRPLLPASSLKGVLRSTAERILRSMQPDRTLDRIPLADEPFVHKAGRSPDEYRQWLRTQPRGAIADSELIEWAAEQKLPSDSLIPQRIYALLSPASQLFGATPHSGLIQLDDATAAVRPSWRRSHVAIDRFTGGVGEGPFIEQLTPAAVPLTTTLTLTNFALWQIALLALAFRELSRGYGAIGGGTRKGQGQVRIEVPLIEFSYTQLAYDHGGTGVISAQARLADPPWQAAEVPTPVSKVERRLNLLPELLPLSELGWRDQGMVQLRVEGAQVQDLFRAAVERAWAPWIRLVIEE